MIFIGIKREEANVIYKPLGKSGLTVSEVGRGCEHLQDKPLEQIQSVLDEAFDANRSR